MHFLLICLRYVLIESKMRTKSILSLTYGTYFLGLKRIYIETEKCNRLLVENLPRENGY
jgi:hypothetical protein